MSTKILVIDNPLAERQRDFYSRIVTGLDRDVEVLFAATGVAAESFLPNVDLAIVLWELPDDGGGAKVVRSLTRRKPGLPVIAVTQALDLRMTAAAKALGVCDLLIKPPQPKRLQAAVREALRGGAYHPLLSEYQNGLIGDAECWLNCLNAIAQLTDVDSPLLLTGENGTGKNKIVEQLHLLGKRSQSPFISVNVATITTSLAESILFGHRKGAFTGADDDHAGHFSTTNDGVLFLDEIGELAAELQAKLLRVLEERKFYPLGSTKEESFQGRLICATNRSLIDDVRAGRFREDLYYRISTHEIRVPPLRERGDDLWLLLKHFLHQYAGDRDLRLSPETRSLLARYPFAGNIRELENLIVDAVHRCDQQELRPFHLPIDVMEQRECPSSSDSPPTSSFPAHVFALPQKEATKHVENMLNHEYLPRVLQRANGNVKRASEVCGLDPKTFRKKWKDADLEPLS